MRNGELTVVIQPEDNSSDEFFIRIPVLLLLLLVSFCVSSCVCAGVELII